MNKKRRESLRGIEFKVMMAGHNFAVLRNSFSKRLEELNEFKREIEDLKNEEEQAIENTPLQFQDSDRFIESEDAVAEMEEIIANLEAMTVACKTVIKNIDEMDALTVLNDVTTSIRRILGEVR